MTNEYILVDSGEGKKLERFGDFLLSRPDPEALWQKSLAGSDWALAQAVFVQNETMSKWQKKVDMPKNWTVKIGDLNFLISLSTFKHVGVFPEHEENWRWLSEQVGEVKARVETGTKVKALNLFGYTGGATLALAKAGAEVVHVDSSKPALTVAAENAKLNQLQDAPIKWILEDVKKFVEREIKRGHKYSGVVMDPPSFGRGVKGEVWKIEDDLLSLLQSIKKILEPQGFLLLNGYASGYTPLAYAELLSSVFDIDLEKIEKGELLIKEQTPRAFALPAGIFARFAF